MALDGGNGDRDILAFDPAPAAACLQIFRRHEDAHGGAVHPDDRRRVGVEGELDEFEKTVGGELVGRPLVALDGVGPCPLALGDEPGSTAPRRGDLVVDVVDERGALRVEVPGVARHAVRTTPPTERAHRTALPLPFGDSGRIQFVAGIPREPQHPVSVDGHPAWRGIRTIIHLHRS